MIDIDAIIIYNKELTGHGEVISKNLLESAFASWHYFETPEEQISSVIRGIIKNHPFRDGNKRTACLVLFKLIEACDVDYTLSDSELEEIVVSIAENKYDIDVISNMIFKG